MKVIRAWSDVRCGCCQEHYPVDLEGNEYGWWHIKRSMLNPFYWSGSWINETCGTSNGEVHLRKEDATVPDVGLDQKSKVRGVVSLPELCAHNGQTVLFTRKLDLVYIDRSGNYKQRYQQPYAVQVETEVQSFLREIQSTKLREIPLCRMTQQPVLVECIQKTAFELTASFRCRSCYP